MALSLAKIQLRVEAVSSPREILVLSLDQVIIRVPLGDNIAPDTGS